MIPMIYYCNIVLLDMVMDAEPESVTASAEHQREEELQVQHFATTHYPPSPLYSPSYTNSDNSSKFRISIWF